MIDIDELKEYIEPDTIIAIRNMLMKLDNFKEIDKLLEEKYGNKYDFIWY